MADVKSVTRGAVTMSSASVTATVSISDIAKAMLFIKTRSNSANARQSSVLCEITNGTTLTFTADRADSNIVVEWEIGRAHV